MATKKLAQLSPAARAARIKILAANPGTRAAIPTNLLPAQYQAGRKAAVQRKAENATLYNPAQILSGNDLRNAVTSEVNLKLNPQLSAQDRLIASLTGSRDLSNSRLNDYFTGYNKQTAGVATGLQQSGQQLATQLATNAQQTQNTLGNISQGIQDRTAADVAVRGPGLQDQQPALNTVDFAKTQAVGAQQDYANQAGARSDANIGLSNTIAQVAPMRATEAMAGLSNKFNQQIIESQSKRADIEATRGDLTASTLNTMRNDQFTNLATLKGLDIKASDLAETVRSNKAGEVLTGKAIDQRNKDSIRDARTQSEKLAFDKQYKAAQLDIKRGIDPVTGKRLPKGAKKAQTATDALNAWKLDFAKKHGYLPQTGPGATDPNDPTFGSHGGVIDPKTGKRVLTQNEVNTNVKDFATNYSNIVEQFAQKHKGDRQTGGIKAGQDMIKNNPGADPLLVSIALDNFYDGYVSRANERKLRNRGLVPKDFGYKGFSDRGSGKRAAKKVPGVQGFGNTP